MCSVLLASFCQEILESQQCATQNGKNKPCVEAIQDACHENEISLVCQFWANLKPRFLQFLCYIEVYEKVARKKRELCYYHVRKVSGLFFLCGRSESLTCRLCSNIQHSREWAVRGEKPGDLWRKPFVCEKLSRAMSREPGLSSISCSVIMSLQLLANARWIFSLFKYLLLLLKCWGFEQWDCLQN